MKYHDLTTEVAKTLIAQIEADPKGWRAPWKDLPGVGLPTNATTGKRYNGGNVIVLGMTATMRGYRSNQWATYKQWAGEMTHDLTNPDEDLWGTPSKAQVRKGEKGTYIAYWQPTTKQTKKNDAGEDETTASRGFYKVYTVFNADQVDRPETAAHYVDPDNVPTLTGPERLERAESFVRMTGARITWAGNTACYRPAPDDICMPGWEQFVDTDRAYATVSHELAHWTGHESRLARTFGKKFGDLAYAAEELVAEMSSAFTCAILGIPTIERTDHAAYLATWMRLFKDDPTTLWTAASKAQAATDHLVDLAERKGLHLGGARSRSEAAARADSAESLVAA